MAKKSELTKTLTFRTSEEQYNSIVNASRNANMTHGEYIRKQLAGRRVYIRQEIIADVPQLKRVIAELGKIGSNLNQLVHHLNSGGKMTTELLDYTHKAVSAVYAMKHEIELMGGEFYSNSKARLRKER